MRPTETGLEPNLNRGKALCYPSPSDRRLIGLWRIRLGVQDAGLSRR